MMPPNLGEGVIKKLQYYWGSTMCEDILDSNDSVRIAIQGSGIVRMQIVVVNPLNGAIKFSSMPFEMIVSKKITPKNTVPTHCGSISCGNVEYKDSDSICNDDCVCKDSTDFDIAMDQEMRIRAEADNAIWDYIDKLGDNLVITAPNGSKYKLVVDNEGKLSTQLAE